MTVVQMLSRRPDRRWEAARVRPTIVPVLSLGRRVLASEGPDTLADTFLLSAPAVAAGGPQLRNLSLSSGPFEASSMQAVISITSQVAGIRLARHPLPSNSFLTTGGRQGPDGYAR